MTEMFRPSSGTRFITDIFGGDTATPRWKQGRGSRAGEAGPGSRAGKQGREGTVNQHRATCEHNHAGDGQ